MTTPYGSAFGGPKITVGHFFTNPLWIASKVYELIENKFIASALLRNAGGNPSGIVLYNEGEPLFLTSDVEQIAEYGEIPVAIGAGGVPKVGIATKRGLAVRLSREMRDKNQIDKVNRQLVQLVNTFVRANDRALLALLQSAAVPTAPVSTAWDATGSTPRTDLADAIRTISTAAPNGATDEWFGFEPDTLVVHPGLLATLLDNEQVLKVYQGNIADQSILYTGALPSKIFGLDVVQSLAVPVDRVLVLQRNVIGFYSDARPFEVTPLYPEGGGPNGGPRETWRADATQERVAALDQPKAGLWITGVVTP